MITITVLLATVVGTFVLGFADQAMQTPPPSAQFSFEHDSETQELTITHHQGDSLDPAALSFSSTDSTWDDADDWEALGGSTSGDSVSAGDSVTAAFGQGEELRVIWSGPQGDSSAVLARYEN